jgi:hypothetical protein
VTSAEPSRSSDCSASTKGCSSLMCRSVLVWPTWLARSTIQVRTGSQRSSVKLTVIFVTSDFDQRIVVLLTITRCFSRPMQNNA